MGYVHRTETLSEQASRYLAVLEQRARLTSFENLDPDNSPAVYDLRRLIDVEDCDLYGLYPDTAPDYWAELMGWTQLALDVGALTHNPWDLDEIPYDTQLLNFLKVLLLSALEVRTTVEFLEVIANCEL